MSVATEAPPLADIAASLAAEALPGEQVEVYATRGTSTEVRIHDGDVEHLHVASDAGVGIRVIYAQLEGFASAGTLDMDVLRRTLTRARENATFATQDENAGLPGDQGAYPVLDVWDEDLFSWSTDEKVAVAKDLDRRTAAADPRIGKVQATDYSDGWVEVAVANSAGLRASQRRTSASVATVVLAPDGDGQRTGFGWDVARAPGLLDVDRARTEAVTRAVAQLGAQPRSGGRMPVVFDPRVTAAFLGVVGASLSGEAVLKGRSLFGGRLGDQVGAPHVSIVDDPTEARSTGASPHDAEGVASRRTPLIVDGALAAFVYNTHAGRRAGMASTGSAVRGGYSGGAPGSGVRLLLLQPQGVTREWLLATVPHGLYVESAQGFNVANPVTGDFSIGITGFLIRNGELAEPVREMTVASTIQRMLTDLAMIADDVDYRSRSVGQTVLVSDMAVSGA